MTDATALAAAIADGRVTPRAAMAASLACAKDVPGAVCRVLTEDVALAAADGAAPGPFSGVPFLGKDLGSAAHGLGIAAGVPALRTRAEDPTKDSALFAQFRAMGLVPFGLTSVPEFGLALSTEPRGMPPAANPFDPTHSAGGSSGGAALAVASGIVAIAHATDAAGSIRVPAACCGVWGLKPSRGATPEGPDFGNHLMGIASELVLARSLRDVATVFHAVTGTPPDARRDQTFRIGLCLPEETAPETVAALKATAATLREHGHVVTEMPPPYQLAQACDHTARMILSVSLADWIDALGLIEPDITPISAAIAHEGRAMTGTQVFAITRDLARLSHDAAALFDSVDALLMPVLSGTPPKIGSFSDSETSAATRFARMAQIAPMASLANIAGLPALAFPAAVTNGLPIGAQLFAPLGKDAELLALAANLAHTAPVPFPHPIAGLPT
ncbi:MAG: amidase family protein [Marivita sp.]|uniref:amidase family protein n=1 Tax=Marivita sp. TaxID=2003365 RepID=UPI003EF37D95